MRRLLIIIIVLILVACNSETDEPAVVATIEPAETSSEFAAAVEQESPSENWQPPISISGEAEVEDLALVSYTSRLKGTVVTPPRELVDFTMPATTGEDFTFSEQGGKLSLVYFGYLTCPDVCPTTMADMKRAYEAVGAPSSEVNVIFVTVDPERDTPERMKRYAEAFNEDFIGLIPESDDQLTEVTDSFGVTYIRREVDSALEYLIDHSAAVLLVGPDGRLISQYPFGIPYTEIANDLRVMLDFMRPYGDSITTVDAEVDTDPGREYRIVIPEGTGSLIAMGEDPGIIPLKIELMLGEKDILVLENHDFNDYLVGGIWVAPFETTRKQFYEPQTFVGLCTVTVGRDLIEIIVSAAQ